MIELKLDGHVIYKLDVVTHYQEQIKRHQTDMREQMTVAANLRDDRDILIRERDALHSLRHEREDVISDLKCERDALKDAARLALDAISDEQYVPRYMNVKEAITALKAVL